MRSLFRDTLSILILILISLTPTDALAGKAKSVNQDEIPVILKKWPIDINWKFWDRGSNADYSIERWAVFGDIGYGEMKNRTYVSVRYLNPGYHWVSGYTGDVRESFWFTKKTGWFQHFNDAKWESGQLFECSHETKCGFRNLKFTVENETCQWVYNNTELHYGVPSFRNINPWSVIIIHCGDTNPFTEDHFENTAESIKITYPGSTGKVSPRQIKSTQNPSNLPLERAETKCAELGFTKGTEKFGDCVMKLLN